MSKNDNQSEPNQGNTTLGNFQKRRSSILSSGGDKSPVSSHSRPTQINDISVACNHLKVEPNAKGVSSKNMAPVSKVVRQQQDASKCGPHSGNVVGARRGSDGQLMKKNNKQLNSAITNEKPASRRVGSADQKA
jgi:hypothetical protein